MKWPGQKRRGAGACGHLPWKGVQGPHHPRTHPPPSSTGNLNRIPLGISESLPLINYFCINAVGEREKSIIWFQMGCKDPGSQRSSLPSL